MSAGIADLLSELAPELLHEVTILIHLVLVSDSPQGGLIRAQKAVLADAADAAADAALRKMMAK
jgi:hypothetical protein